jgi:hypothetical protein
MGMPNYHTLIYDSASITCSRLPPSNRSTSPASLSYFLPCPEAQAKAAQNLSLAEGTSPSWKVQQECCSCFLWSIWRALGAPARWEKGLDCFKSVSILNERKIGRNIVLDGLFGRVHWCRRGSLPKEGLKASEDGSKMAHPDGEVRTFEANLYRWIFKSAYLTSMNIPKSGS